MESGAAKFLPPTPQEIETARRELYGKLENAEKQPILEKRGADEVFAEKRKILEGLLSAKI